MKKTFINGCATSPYLAQAFDALGWSAWTCDLKPSEGWKNHIQGDILDVLGLGWTFGVFHPDCQYLANSGVRWRLERNEWAEVENAARFFNEVDGAPFPHVTENPIPHRYARQYIRKYDQLIQPWNFGALESKAICLWLTGVPDLVKTVKVKPDNVRQSVWREPPSVNRRANRSRNFPEVCMEWARQWNDYFIAPEKSHDHNFIEQQLRLEL